jgi:hypothetical protein
VTERAANRPAGESGPERTEHPVLIIGTERSGSNLLRLILNEHPSLAIPHPPHLMRYLAPLADSYGDLTIEGNRRAVVRDALTILRRHIHPWPFDVAEEVVTQRALPSVFGIVAEIYEQYRLGVGKQRWGCKSTFTIHYVDEVLADYPGARFLWLIRDPRDVATSSKRSVFNPCHPYRTARLWRRQQELGLAVLERWGPERVYQLRYEDLVSRPEPEIRAVCAFLDLPFDERMLRHHDSPSARETASLSQSWQNTDRPITTARVGRYRSGLTPTELRLVEAEAGALLSRFGYPGGQPDAARRSAPPRAGVLVRELLLRCAVEYRSMRADRNYRRRLSRDTTVRLLRVRAWARRWARRR